MNKMYIDGVQSNKSQVIKNLSQNTKKKQQITSYQKLLSKLKKVATNHKLSKTSLKTQKSYNKSQIIKNFSQNAKSNNKSQNQKSLKASGSSHLQKYTAEGIKIQTIIWDSYKKKQKKHCVQVLPSQSCKLIILNICFNHLSFVKYQFDFYNKWFAFSCQI